MRIYGYKTIKDENWKEIVTLNKPVLNLINDTFPGDIVTFDYSGGVSTAGHDKSPQVLILGSPSPKMDAQARTSGRITGVNLRYLTIEQANRMVKWVGNNAVAIRQNPKPIVKMLLDHIPITTDVYRQYFTDQIPRISDKMQFIKDMPKQKEKLKDDKEFIDSMKQKIIEAKKSKNRSFKDVMGDINQLLEEFYEA